MRNQFLKRARLQAKIILDKAELAAKQQLNELYEEIKAAKGSSCEYY